MVFVCPPVCYALHTQTQFSFTVVDEKRSNRNVVLFWKLDSGSGSIEQLNQIL